MVWHKWFVRGLVFSSFAAAACVALLYVACTNPAETRHQVIKKLSQKFTGAIVNVTSAQLIPLGYIDVTELTMARRDDLDRANFLYAPSVRIYHDKEQLLDGHLAIRKVELQEPHLRIVRFRDGSFNLQGVLGPLMNEQVPMIIMHQATVVIEDHTDPAMGPVLEIADVDLTVINDPLPELHLEAAGSSDVAGPITLTAKARRNSDEMAATLAAAAVPVNAALLHRLAMVAPEFARQFHNLTGTAKIEAILVKLGSQPTALSYDVNAEFHDGTFTDARLPRPLERIEAVGHIHDGRLTEGHLAAGSGTTTFDVKVRDAYARSADPAGDEQCVGELDARVEHLPIDATLFACLPPALQPIQDDYKPAGLATVTHTFRRDGRDGWRKEWTVCPEGMTAECSKFRYPLQKITGTVNRTTSSDGQSILALNLKGMAGERPVRLMGRIDGEKPHDRVELDVWADDIPIDDVLLGALDLKSRSLAARFSPGGRTDIKAQVRRLPGRREFSNRYFLRFHDASATFDQFPYLFEKVSGVLDILPDHWECRDFHGTHKGCDIWVSGRSVPVPLSQRAAFERDDDSKPHRVEVNIQGKNILLDEEFTAALANRPQLQKAWHMLQLMGRLSFGATVVDLPNEPQNIDVGVTLRGCAMQPRFFPCLLEEVSGSVNYAHDKVTVKDVHARHGTSVLGLGDGVIKLKAGGGFLAELDAITGDPVVPTPDLLKALPMPLRRGLEPLQLHDPLAVKTRLVVDVSPDQLVPPKVQWDGTARLFNAALTVGVPFTNVVGEVACRGGHNGYMLEDVSGNIDIQQATVLNQPVNRLHGQIEISSREPDTLRLKNLIADWFSGKLGGEALIAFKDVLRYDVELRATQVRLEEIARNNAAANADMQGEATADLHLHGEGHNIGGLKGEGKVEVPNGKLYRLPMLLDLMNAFQLRLPDRTAFEQASAGFTIDGPKVNIQNLSLTGNAFSLQGKGTLNIDGSDLNLNFVAGQTWIMQALPTAVKQTIGAQLFKIKVRGRVSEPRFEQEVVPLVTEPIKRILNKE